MLLLVCFGLGLYAWMRARDAAELARQHGARACEQAGVQLLDHTVALVKMGVRRDESGRLRVLRQYRFDYSRDGSDRMSGGLALLGLKLQWITAPDPPAPVAVEPVSPAQLPLRSFGSWG
ncbi:MAG: DUF3301 domain-containing protein [Aquimonas sp.]|nr:DUF3301 domain-containing protein [Aquimonas sp.]